LVGQISDWHDEAEILETHNISVKYNLMSADLEVEMVLVGKVLLKTLNLSLVIEFLTTATAILARSGALGTGAIEMNAVSILDALYTLILL
jgi:hypothetical protein